MALLTAEQLARLRDIIRDASTSVAISTTGMEVSTEELQRLVTEGYVDPDDLHNVVLDSYEYGRLMAQLPRAHEMTYQKFVNHLARNPVELSDQEKRAFEFLQGRAGQFCVGLGTRYEGELTLAAADMDQELAEAFRYTLQDEGAQSTLRRETVGRLTTKLRQMSDDWARDWGRIASTESHMAHQVGFIEDVAARYGQGEQLAKMPEPNACPDCQRLYLGPDGRPRVESVEWWQQQGVANYGLKRADWRPVMGAMHPWCQCQVVRIPAGWGFDEDWDVVPLESIEKSTAARPGEMREWKDGWHKKQADGTWKPVAAATSYASRTLHRGLGTKWDKVQDMIQGVKEGDPEATRTAAAIMALMPGMKGFRGLVVAVPGAGAGKAPLTGLARELTLQGVGQAFGGMRRTKAVQSARQRRRKGKRGLTADQHSKTMAADLGKVHPDTPIMLVDDVFTSGATLEGAALALRRAGHRGPISAAVAGHYENVPTVEDSPFVPSVVHPGKEPTPVGKVVRKKKWDDRVSSWKATLAGLVETRPGLMAAGAAEAFSRTASTPAALMAAATELVRSEGLSKARKLHYKTTFRGLPISIENRRGSKRYWYDPPTKRTGETLMRWPYGYIRMTEGADGDHVDVFMGAHEDAKSVYVIHQLKSPAFKEPDEDKVMLGFLTARAAKKAYLLHFDSPKFYGSMTVIPIQQFVDHALGGEYRDGQAIRKGGGPFIGPRGGKWADAAHTIPWRELKVGEKMWARSAHEALNPDVSAWVFDNEGGAKTRLFNTYAELTDREKTALAADAEHAVKRHHGSEYITVYRSLRPGDDPKSMGGMSATTDLSTRGKATDVHAFRVHHSDILVHWGQPESWLNSKRFRHEREVILKPNAKVHELELAKAGGAAPARKLSPQRTFGWEVAPGSKKGAHRRRKPGGGYEYQYPEFEAPTMPETHRGQRVYFARQIEVNRKMAADPIAAVSTVYLNVSGGGEKARFVPLEGISGLGGRNLGVQITAHEVPKGKKAIMRFARHARTEGLKLMVDSGEFPRFAAERDIPGQQAKIAALEPGEELDKAQAKLVKLQTKALPLDFDQVFGAYERLADQFPAGTLTVVAPDKIGDGIRTAELRQKYADRVQALMARGVHFIVPFQSRTAEGLAHDYVAASEAFGEGTFTIGLPMAKKPMPMDVMIPFVTKLYKAGRFPKLHFLGGSQPESMAERTVQLVAAAYWSARGLPEARVLELASSPKAALRGISKVKSAKDVLTSEAQAELEPKMRAWAGAGGDPDFDETEAWVDYFDSKPEEFDLELDQKEGSFRQWASDLVQFDTSTVNRAVMLHKEHALTAEQQPVSGYLEETAKKERHPGTLDRYLQAKEFQLERFIPPESSGLEALMGRYDKSYRGRWLELVKAAGETFGGTAGYVGSRRTVGTMGNAGKPARTAGANAYPYAAQPTTDHPYGPDARKKKKKKKRKKRDRTKEKEAVSISPVSYVDGYVRDKPKIEDATSPELLDTKRNRKWLDDQQEKRAERRDLGGFTIHPQDTRQ